MKKSIRIIAAAIMFTNLFTLLLVATPASAACSGCTCIGGIDYSSVDSVKSACTLGKGHGALWINGDASTPNNDEIKTSQKNGYIPIFLRGLFYSSSANKEYSAHYIKFCNNEVPKDPGAFPNEVKCGEVSYIKTADPYYADIPSDFSLYRGKTGSSGGWTSNPGTKELSLYLDGFIREANRRENADGSVTYSKKIHLYRCSQSSPTRRSQCYTDPSNIVVNFSVDPIDPKEGSVEEVVYIAPERNTVVDANDYSDPYYILSKTQDSAKVDFDSRLVVERIEGDFIGSSQGQDALSRVSKDYIINGSGTYTLVNGEEKTIGDSFRYLRACYYGVTYEYYPSSPDNKTVKSIDFSYCGNTQTSSDSVSIFRNAEALFGLESSGTAQNSNIVDYLWQTDLAHAAPSGRSFTASFSTGPTSVSAATGAESDPLRRTIFLTTKDEDHITLSYSHSISRGLSTTYESYQPNTTTISTPWSTSYTINGVAQSAHARSNNINTTAPTTGLDTVNLGSHTIDVENGDVKFGTYSEAHCETLSHSGIAGITVPIGPTIMSEQPLSTTACLNLFRPWNFELSISTTLDEDDDNHILIADGNSTSASVRVKNHVHLTAEDADYDGRHASRTPEDTKIGIYQFIIGGDVDASIAKNSIFGGEVISGVSDISSAISSILTSIPGVSLLQDLTGDTKTISGGILTGKEATHSLSVSKDTNIPAGAKVCVVAAVNYVSSEYINDGRGEGYGVYGSPAEIAARNTWLTSNISCRTITSKSLLQIHGGDIMTGGTIDAAAMKIGGTTFNSWADYGIVAIGDVNTADYAGVSSGAFGTFGRDTSGTNTLCDISHIVVSNDKCFIDPVSDREIGKSGIYPDTKLIDTIMARFNGTKINGVTIYDVGASTARHSIGYVNGDGSPVVSDGHVSADPVSGQYYYLRDLERAGDGGHPSASLDHGTEVIRVTDDAGLIIDQNLTYADGNYLNPFDIPQRIIIVENGNVVITPNVTHLDAWIIVKNGNLITCTEFNAAGNILAREHRSYYGVCDGRLDINGYVVADYIAFERTFFEQPSVLSSTTDRNVIYGNYGERITLPYTSMMWAYNKLHISSISQPSTVYTHTLAPRF